ncbi:type II RES/Xre toxin-antitoxin system antitoxin [Moheibacter sediminis]|uniref:Putative toxin-antitoxin system antitoxin component, TIGR02293 family n=1 Tax=Moheibacter sediminis TaxID=1434700 RepID=A0A1W1Z3J8_9FLAO|nr:antitoxin Xre/MbcA/ParS toxin-binding domain-containing protein [Moheibacter sediminis]SMC43015.1 putative toxin-antitoxin system antitoxin component, TIGR02293 family [Moheibacter sediminis]
MDIVKEAVVEYRRTGTIANRNRSVLMQWVRGGIDFDMFQDMVSKFPFTSEEWSQFLHLSERTIQRYKKEEKNFDSLQSEKILQISLLYQRGVEIFGDKNNFNSWLSANNIALGNVKPKELLDNAFGIALLEEELMRIEHGVLA